MAIRLPVNQTQELFGISWAEPFGLNWSSGFENAGSQLAIFRPRLYRTFVLYDTNSVQITIALLGHCLT